jgi:hypothetical protein
LTGTCNKVCKQGYFGNGCDKICSGNLKGKCNR